MDTAEIVVHKPKGHSSRVILNFLREGVRQPRKAANAHPHGKILALNKTGAYMLRIGISADCFHVAANADCWGVSRMGLDGSAVNLLQLSIVAVHAKRAFHGLKVCSVAVCSDLYATADTAGAIFHELFSPSRVTPAHQIAHTELCICIQCGPRPSVAPSFSFLFCTDVLRLRSHKIPDFVALQTAHFQIANVPVMVSGARLS